MTAHFDPAHDALNRMKRAHDRGTGCHLTAEMIASLGVSIVGDLWGQPDPRGPATRQRDEQAGREERRS